MAYKVVIVSDLHAGSIFGLLPPNFRDASDTVVQQNAGQRYLSECWTHFCTQRVKPIDPDIVIVNGDAIEGQQFKQRATELCLPLLSDQVDAAEESLKLLKKCSPNAIFYATQGTAYHVGDAARDEEALYKVMGFERYAGLGTGKYCKEVLDLDIQGVRINIAHHVSCTTGLYKGSGIDREGAFAKLATHDKIHCVIRSHVHNFAKTEYARRHNVTTPCWQLQTRYMRHHSVHRLLPDLGGIIVHVDPAALKAGQDPIYIEKAMYDLPPIVPTRPKLRQLK